MSKIVKLIAVVELDDKTLVEVPLSQLSSFCQTYSYEKVFQSANPMAPGSTDLFGIAVKLSLPYKVSEDCDLGEREQEKK